MGSDQVRASGAISRSDALWFDPDVLVITTSGPLADPDRLNTPVEDRFVQNIKTFGVREPILVRRNGTSEKTGLPITEVVNGRQRVRAAREANKILKREGGEPIRVPALMVRASDEEAQAIMIFTNEIRKEDSPIVRARRSQKFMALGRSKEETANVFGTSVKTIEQWLELLELNGDVQKAIDTKEVAANVVRPLAKLPREKQTVELNRMREAGTMKGRNGREAAERASNRPQAVASGAPVPPLEPVRLPSRPKLKRFLTELEETVLNHNGEAIEKSKLQGALSILNFVINGRVLPHELRGIWKKAISTNIPT
jgi:ParB family transcriptional regulator, chromosome partitioning protein